MKYREHRTLCDCAVTVVHRGRRIMADLRNVSERGARLRGLSGVSPGTRLTLDLHVSQPRASVAWTRGDLTGIRFDRPLTRSELMRLRGTTEAALVRHATAGPARFREL
ncbi:PilZ domain-containing protein [Histidinibacterium lentulum]|uniref:PilZ domain-containing protein n=1 Tax=Histidinibacterium lentulum TaxID=2480588 RepID=A0A3N2QS82_9RHOB|nr:PilZ domain-containing protein [Histidinibacterium lentulum]ROT98029.1 PilZ domain-containing protein [Histidinibacterium lentulum]